MDKTKSSLNINIESELVLKKSALNFIGSKDVNLMRKDARRSCGQLNG